MGIDHEDIKWSVELTKGSMKISTLMVLESEPGTYYIGRMCMETDKQSEKYTGNLEHHSRETAFFTSKQSAQEALFWVF